MEVWQGNHNCNHSLKREKPARCAGIPLEPLNECCLTVKRMPLVARDGKIYRISETGKLSILKPGADWETLAVNDLGEPSYATSAIEDGKIYLRTSSSLYCFANQ